MVLKYLPLSNCLSIVEEIKPILLRVLQKYLPFSLPDPNVFRTTTRERTFEKKNFNDFKRRSFYDMQVECRLEKREKKWVSNAIFSAEKKTRKKGIQMQYSQLRKGKKGFQMQFSQLRK